MKPSPHWEQKIIDKEKALERSPELIETFRSNILGKNIDDVANAVTTQAERRRGENQARNATRQAWNTLGRLIDVDLLHLVDEKSNGKPVMGRAGKYRATTGSVEFAYLATKLRPLLGEHTCEIGAGYGGLARALLGAHDHRYTIVDFPVIQRVQRYYLADENGEVDDRVSYLDPGDPLPEADLYINTRSMMEMTLEQVEWYLSEMKGPSNFFTMNRDRCNKVDEWVVPQDWYVVKEETHPMRLVFKMVTWSIPP